MENFLPQGPGTKPIQEIEKDLKKCKKLCKPDCKSYVYEYTDTVEQISETMLEEQNLILVAIIADDPEVHSFMYLPQYQNVELFSYIGGFMGCWLGLSFWTFSHYVCLSMKSVKQSLVSIRRRLKISD
ncbi:hypothetical protein JTE90_026067 [Oedothorax gibbosus]|uniref:Uncharacterized protein n=1 Tax=Oedothorax gibbosus TaxID=931172 RepID=A0AAV6TXQ8_9ARAC|nr:hypothetical protein JTE90_026067 [Oedothorax gibbosus]